VATLGLIPARGGSKGIPRKNVLPIAGRPLIAWTIAAASAASAIDRVVVTTDDAEIAALAAEHGAEVPFLRPAELACDETPGIDPVLHALDMLPGVDTLVLLQPTSPLRTADDIDAAVALSAAHESATVVGVTEVAHAGWTFAMDAGGVLDIGTAGIAARRQDMVPQFTLNGAIYVAAVDRLRAMQSFLTPGTVGYPMPLERSVDIDTMFDWRVAEMLLSDRA
jgi:CMP-N-acetylneuraminic acid synthetase